MSDEREVMREPHWHYLTGPGRWACGQNAPNDMATEDLFNVTCPDCQREAALETCAVLKDKAASGSAGGSGTLGFKDGKLVYHARPLNPDEIKLLQRLAEESAKEPNVVYPVPRHNVTRLPDDQLTALLAMLYVVARAPQSPDEATSPKGVRDAVTLARNVLYEVQKGEKCRP